MFINMPIFFFGSVSVALFYLTAQKALNPKTWMKEVIYLPLLIALGIGMSVNNAKAVLEAVFNHQTGFVRTPKYGLDKGEGKATKQSTGWKSSKYKAMKSVTPIIEFGFGVFFLMVVFSNFINENYATAILLTPFPIGFFFTSFPSLKRMFSGFMKNNVEESIDSGN